MLETGLGRIFGENRKKSIHVENQHVTRKVFFRELLKKSFCREKRVNNPCYWTEFRVEKRLAGLHEIENITCDVGRLNVECLNFNVERRQTNPAK